MTTATTVRFLSDAYLSELEKLSQGDRPAIPHVNVRLQFHVTDTPDGPVNYYMVIERGLFTAVGRGRVENSDLEITTTYRNLADFQNGELHAATAFVTGQFAVTGDKAKLLELMVVIQAGYYHQFTADLSSRTTW
jgi:hypothetical protein